MATCLRRNTKSRFTNVRKPKKWPPDSNETVFDKTGAIHALISELGVVTQDLDPEDKLPWINTRNDLVHQAKSKPTPELLNEIERLEIFVERLFLRVLGVPTDAGLDPDEPFESHAYAYREPTLFDWD